MDTAERAASIVNQIEQSLLEGREIADILRMCVSLAGLVGAHDLQEWASKELRGYSDDDELPPYRTVGAVIQIDAITGNTRVTGQTVAPYQLPKEVQEHIDGTVALREGIAQLDLQSRKREGESDSIKLQPGAAAYACQLIDKASGNPFQQTMNLYYAIPRSVFYGVVDQVKTVASEFVANLRLSTPGLDTAPSADSTNSAIALAVTGDHASINVVNANGSAHAAADVTQNAQDVETRVLTRQQLGWTIVGVVVAIGIAVVGWLL